MRRRTLLQRLTNVLGALALLGDRIFARDGAFTPKQRAALVEVASLVLPSALGSGGFEDIAQKFERYVREYRAGADTDHGYGVTHVVSKPPSPARTYARQLSLLPSPVTRISIEQLLRQTNAKELPRVPDGKNVIVDLMSFYFRSSDANDLCYSAAIGRDDCRGLAGSELPPPPLRSLP
jgi:hypothetical protein